jgi:microcystin-dependent protein
MEVFIGTIQTFAFPFNPNGWQQCNGQTLAISQFSALFALIGTTYGGNGTTTFQLPNLQGRFPLCQGNGSGLTPRVIGEASGTESQTLLMSNMPQHSHVLNATTAAATASSPLNTLLLANANGTDNQLNAVTVQIYGPTPTNTTLNAASIGPAGSSLPFPMMPPYLVINFCIAMVGIFPSRN